MQLNPFLLFLLLEDEKTIELAPVIYSGGKFLAANKDTSNYSKYHVIYGELDEDLLTELRRSSNIFCDVKIDNAKYYVGRESSCGTPFRQKVEKAGYKIRYVEFKG